MNNFIKNNKTKTNKISFHISGNIKRTTKADHILEMAGLIPAPSDYVCTLKEM